MALAAGTRLGPYEIVASLGAGGMGEVYRARDTRLDRSVAIKILPLAVADSAEHRARFEREARAIAALNHPHICTLHDVGEANGATFLVMELVAGETLAQRLKKGRLPLDQTLRLGIDIADALQAAHRQGIVHRDLKPGNVMLTTGGAKLLDFGLARLMAPRERAAVAGWERTTEERLTGRGLIVGTLPYMAPEQLEGGEVDARTDLWALGAILYEMLTGRAAFEGASSASLIGAILEREPAPVSTSQPLTPPGLERLVRKCLAKQPDARWQSAADVADELRWIASGSGTGVVARPSRRIWWRWLTPLAVGALVVASLIGLSVGSRFRAVPAPPVIRSVIKLEPGFSLTGQRAEAPWGFNQPTRTAMVLASNGRFVVYSAVQDPPSPPQTKPQLYVRQTDQLEARPIAGTEGGSSPFLSPDDRWVGFWAAGKLMKVPLEGGVPVTLCDAKMIFGASWGPGGTIVFSPSPSSGLLTVPADGGQPETLTTPDTAREEFSHRLPHWLADGKGVLFTIMREAFDLEPRVALLDLRTRTWRVVLEDGADGRHVPAGHLVFLRRGSLMAVPFDPSRGQPVGQPIPLIAGVVQTLNLIDVPNTAAGQLSISASGALVYAPGGILPDIDSRLVWVDQQGDEQPAASVQGFLWSARLSPDGRRIAYTTLGMRSRVWVYDLDRGTASPLTGEGKVGAVTWTPDGQRVVFNWSKSGWGFNLHWQPADGSALMEQLTTGDQNQVPGSFSADGSTLAFVEEDRPDTRSDILLLGVRSRRATPFLNSKANEFDPTFSPDGRWLAYVSDESGRFEVYVRPFPGAGGKWQISAEGGWQPLWGRNGRQLFYWRGLVRPQFWAVDIRTEGAFSAGRPRLLFEGSRFQSGSVHCWDVSLDGQRFLMVKMEERKPAPLTEMVLVQNWFEELKAKVPTGK